MMKKALFLFLLLYASISRQAVAQKQSQELIDSLLTELPKSREDTNKVNLLNDLSVNYAYINPDEGIKYGIQALKLSESLGWMKGLSYANLNIGGNYSYKSDYFNALKCYLQSLKINEALNDKAIEAKVLSGIGCDYCDKGNYPKALEYNLKALQIREEMGDKRGTAGSLNNVGLVYFGQREYSKALDYYQKALNINKEINNKQWEAINLCNIGEIYESNFFYVKALEYNFEALELNKELGNKSGLANNFDVIGRAYLEIANSSNKEPLNKLLKGNRAASLQQSKRYIDSSIAIYKEIGDLIYIKEAYKTLSEIQSFMGDNKEALESYKLYSAAKDSFNNVDKEKRLTQTAMQYEFDKKEASTKADQDKKDIVQRNIRNSIAVGLVGALALLIIVLRQRNKVKKEKLLTEKEKKVSEELLLNILPAEVAEELKTTGSAKAKAFTMVTVMFTDFKDFTRISEKVSAELLVDEIHHCFSAFDNIIQKHKVEKIKTIGDAYLCASGLPVSNYTHAVDMLHAAFEIRQFMLERKKEKEAKGEIPFELRIGIHTGPVVAGIVGVKKYAYDIWGDTVNLATRMEQNSEVGKINISGSTFELVKSKFKCEHRGKISAKNKGDIDMYFVEN